MEQKILIRLDDACPTMNHKRWARMESILDSYGIKPMVGIIPNNEDPEQIIDSEDEKFWNKVKIWENKGWAIAMHGYNHCYSSDGGLKGLNPVWRRSEFAGLPLKEQRLKIRQGIDIMRNHDISPRYFFAPSHTFDKNTLEAIRIETDIRIICDTIATVPYKYDDFIFIPQQSGHPIRLPLGGFLTICYHPNTMSNLDFDNFNTFLHNKSDDIISFDNLELSNIKGRNLFDTLFSTLYFLRRRINSIVNKIK